MFKRMDWVKCKADGTFWMSITEVQEGGWYRCRFGTQGADAGRFHERELYHYKVR